MLESRLYFERCMQFKEVAFRSGQMFELAQLAVRSKSPSAT